MKLATLVPHPTKWLQGKNWESTTPVGPCLVTPDEVGGVRPALAVRCDVDGTTIIIATADTLDAQP